MDDEGHQTYNDSALIKPRSYQLEMLEESLRQNIIVAMDTGSGKTHIAVLRIQTELERCTSRQLVWFLAPTVALCQQQSEVFRTHLPQYQTRFLAGADGVDKWSNQLVWDAVLLHMHIIVSTHKVLDDALTHGFVRLARLALIVFDEAHHCTAKHPANNILQNFYHPSLASGDRVPYILGLTASPVINAKVGGLEKLEGNMNAVAKTPKTHRFEMLQHVYRPKFVRVLYSPLYGAEADDLPAVKALHDACMDLDLIEVREDFCTKQLKTLLAKARTVYEELGLWCCDWYVRTCISTFIASTENDEFMVSEARLQERKNLRVVLEDVRKMSQYRQDVGSPDLIPISPKAQALLDMLVQYVGSPFTGLVFVQQRVTVAALQALLAIHPVTAHSFKVSTFVGTSVHPSKKTSVAELVEPRNQKSTLEDFRTGEINLIITTSVLEEGIDVSACHTVICYEEPKNLKAFIQRRGRARKEESEYIILVGTDSPKKSANQWEALEEQMKEMYLNEMRELQELRLRENVMEECERTFRVSSTGALLTMENAISHLHHFCATLSADPYVDLRPEFSLSKENDSGLIAATVVLPTVVDPEFRRCKSSGAWRTERNAKKDAAFEACVALHRGGLINDNLMPVLGPKEEPPEIESFGPQSAVVVTSDRIDIWATSVARWNETSLPSSQPESFQDESEQKYFGVALSIEENGHAIASSVVVLPRRLPYVPPFTLYWSENVSYEVKTGLLGRSDVPWLNDEQALTARRVTYMLLESVFGVRIDIGRFDFSILFVPNIDLDGLPAWLEDMQERREAANLTSAQLEETNLGLVRVKGKCGATYIFQNSETTPPCESGGETFEARACLRVKRMPKRRDFLHPVVSAPSGAGASHTATELIPIRDCTIDVLPGSYSLLALFLPSILHRFEVFLVAEELCSTVLEPIKITNLSLVVQAITTPSARDGTDYQRLEFLGDAVLGMCTAVHVMGQHRAWPEGYLTRARSNFTSNSYLARTALRLRLSNFIISAPFTGQKWRPRYTSEMLNDRANGKREMSTKVLADVTEALIGATFVNGGMDSTFTCLQTFFPEMGCTSLRQSHDLLFDATPSAGVAGAYMDDLQRLVGYKFKKPLLLQQAITHASYNADALSVSYQRLEFLGDTVLSYLVAEQLFARQPPYSEDQMHTIRTALVNADFLAFLCMEWTIERKRARVVEEKDSGVISTVDETVEQSLWQYMRHNNAAIAKAQQAAGQRHNGLREEIIQAIEQGNKYPWALLARTEADKFFSDLVESMLGAVYVDSKGDKSACANMLERLGLLKYLRRISNDGMLKLTHPKEQVGHIADSEKVNYETKNTKEGWVCVLKIGGREIVKVEQGTSKIEAENTAATLAVEKLGEVRPARKSAKRKANDKLENEEAAETPATQDATEEMSQ